MKQPTVFLRITLVIMGLAILALCAFVLPAIHDEWPKQFPAVAYLQYPVIAALSATTISFFIALYQAWRLLDYIDKNMAFSQLSVKSLKNIKYCALVISGFYAASLPLIYYIAETDDAPGLLVIGLVFTFAPLVIAVFATVVQKLLQNAIDMKSENDLTV